MNTHNGDPVVALRRALVLLAGVVLLVPQALSQSTQIAGGFHSVDSLNYTYGANYRTPFVMTGSQSAADIGRNTIELTHNDFWKYGSNFIDMNLRQSNAAELALGGPGGAMEVYAIFRSDLSLNKVLGARRFSVGPIRDVSLEGGANLQTKNSSYSPAEKTLFLGPNFQFKMPRGFLSVGVHVRKEWNHEAILGKADNYDPNFNVEASWAIPLPGRHVPLAFAGFATYNAPKGIDSFGNQSVSEYLLRPRLMLDIGQVLFQRRGWLEVGGGVECWHNEYGKAARMTPGGDEVTPFLQATFHLGRAE